jgi:hypothetical protein
LFSCHLLNNTQGPITSRHMPYGHHTYGKKCPGGKNGVGVVHMKVHCGGQALRVGLHLNVWAIAYETSWCPSFWMRLWQSLSAMPLESLFLM